MEFDEEAGTVRCGYAINTGILTTNDVRVVKLHLARDGSALYDISHGSSSLSATDAAEEILERIFSTINV
jgi:hypothetical protein